MNPALSALIKPALALLAVIAVIVAFYVMYEKLVIAGLDLDGQKQLTAQAEKDRNTAIDAASTNALLVAQTARDGDAEVAAVTKERDAALKRATTVSAMLTEIKNAPHTSDCVRSAVVGDTLERLREQHAARAAGSEGPASGAAGASSPAVVPTGPGGAPQGQ
jgi:hypothetical protein